MKTTFRGFAPSIFSAATVWGTGTTAADAETGKAKIETAMLAAKPMIFIMVLFIVNFFMVDLLSMVWPDMQSGRIRETNSDCMFQHS